MLFELAHWVLLGGTIYLALDLIPKGPLTWKLLSKYSLQSQVAIQIILVVGIALLIVQLAIFLLGLFYFIVEDSPVTFGSNGPVLLGILLIPIVSQLFRINVLVNKRTSRLILTLVIIGIDLFFHCFNPSPASSSSSVIESFGNTFFLHYACSVCLFFIVLDVILILKKHKIIK
ncbi:MAG: hypothetical protein ACI8QW_001230 [Saprospiraceae bacterium]|jgi:hypothetical protein